MKPVWHVQRSRGWYISHSYAVCCAAGRTEPHGPTDCQWHLPVSSWELLPAAGWGSCAEPPDGGSPEYRSGCIRAKIGTGWGADLAPCRVYPVARQREHGISETWNWDWTACWLGCMVGELTSPADAQEETALRQNSSTIREETLGPTRDRSITRHQNWAALLHFLLRGLPLNLCRPSSFSRSLRAENMTPKKKHRKIGAHQLLPGLTGFT